MKRLLYILWFVPLLMAGQIKDNETLPDYTLTGSDTVIAISSITILPTTIIAPTGSSYFEARITDDPYLNLILSSDENYVLTRNFQAETKTGIVNEGKDVIENITYFDGLGRAKQNIAIRQAPNRKDIVTHIGYDDYGRQEKEYLPYVVTSNNGAIIDGEVDVLTGNYYNTNYTEDFAGVDIPVNSYSQKEFEASPLNRVLKQAAPGHDWRLGSGHEIEFDYQTNTINDAVKIYEVETNLIDGVYEPTLSGTTEIYEPGELYKTITKDENHDGSDSKLHTTEEFKNKQGQVILKRTYDLVGHDTYYVYDDYGNLTYVFPPKVKTEDNKGVSDIELSELSYQYKYDYRNRLVEKKIPGKGKEEIVYDKLDRPVLTQDANLAIKGEWLFTKYDKFGRVVYTGIREDDNSRLYFQNLANGTKYTQYESTQTSSVTRGDVSMYYTSTAIPDIASEVLTVNYYDEYIDLPETLANTITTSYGETSTDKVKGLPTVSKVKVLEINDWITTVTYYDEKARPIYIYSENEYLETVDIVESKLDFVGKVLETKSTHQKTGQDDIVIVDVFEYDHSGRLLSQKQKINNQIPEEIVANSYDELGQLESKEVGGGLQNIDYNYNVRGWLTAINEDTNNDNDLFNFSLTYNDPTSTGIALFNGNISQTSWNTLNIDAGIKTYNYSYDALNRITKGIDNTGRYNLNFVNYDKNGNITELRRQGQRNTQATSFGTMDDLSYTYDNGNKLTSVSDNASTVYGSFGFKDGNTSGDDYEYDVNGNMISDANKGITSISYNHLNLPKSVKFKGTNIAYVYDASGIKLEKKVFEYGNPTTTQYAGNYIYNILPAPIGKGLVPQPELQFFNQPEGYVKKDGDEFNYVYQYKDHLGNVRLSYTDANKDGKITAPNSNVVFYDDLENSEGWDSVGAKFGGSAVLDSEHVRSGNYSVKIVNPDYNQYQYVHSNVWVPISNNNATEYTFSGWFYSTGPRVRFLLFMNENEETEYSTLFEETDVKTERNQWIYIEKTVSVPVNIDKINLRIGTFGGDYDSAGTVWYDDLKIEKVEKEQLENEIVEESNYYPFGLKHKGYNNVVNSLGNSTAQKFMFNQGTNGKDFQGKEGKLFKVERQEELGLNVDMTKFRMYDYALGRFTSIDPLADAKPQESWTPYQYAYNSPVQYNDPYGDCPWCIGALVGGAIGAAVEYGSQVYDNYQSGMTISNAMTSNIDGSKIAGATVRGLITGATATATGGTSLITQVGANAVGEVTGGMADRSISGEKVLDGGEILTDAIAGGAGGALAKGGEKLFESNVVKNATEVLIERVGSIATKKVVQPIVKKVVKTAIVSGGRAGAKAGVNKTSDAVGNSQNEGSSTQNDSSSKSNIEDRK